MGFKVPLDVWFRDGLAAFAWDTLGSQGSFASTMFDRALVRQLLERHRCGRANEELRIWSLLCLEIWYDEFFRAGSEQRADRLLVPIGASEMRAQ